MDTGMITKQEFIKSLNLLADNYGDDCPVFRNQDIAEAWFNFFKEVCHTDKKLKEIFTHYIVESIYPPKAPREMLVLWEESGKGTPNDLLPLPSVEERLNRQQRGELDNMSLEEMAENRRKIPLIFAIAKNWRGISQEERQLRINDLSKYSASELKMVLSTCHKSNAMEIASRIKNSGKLTTTEGTVFSDMKKYFHSGSEIYRQIAIDWAKDPVNGVEIVKDGSRIIDIRMIDF